jgi:autotransporter-associated beta strand protein
VILNGDGVVEYQNAMTYTGDTSIRRGALQIAQGAALPAAQSMSEMAAF